MYKHYIKLSIVILCAVLLASCSVDETGSDSGKVTISLLGQKPEYANQQAIASILPDDITRIVVRCSGDNMQTISADLPLDGSPLILDIPAGSNRIFTAEAYANDLLRMSGNTAVDYLYAGVEIPIAITLEDLADILLTPDESLGNIVISAGGTQKFSATVTNHLDTSVSWSVNGIVGGNAEFGTIDSTGFYVAPSSFTNDFSVNIRATSNEDSSLYVEVVADLQASRLAVSVSPQNTTVVSSGSLTFVATVEGDSTASVTWAVLDHSCNNEQGIPDSGVITDTGLYTAPTVVYDCYATVRATSTIDPKKYAESVIIIDAPVTIWLSATAATVAPNGTENFAALVKGDINTYVDWSVKSSTCSSSGDVVSTSGIYTAPNVVDDCTEVLLVTSLADTQVQSEVIISVDAPTAISLSPLSVSLSTGQQQNFTATVSGDSNTNVSWSVENSTCTSLGSISAAGVYTAPLVSGDCSETVRVTSAADNTQSATATISISGQINLSISPTSSSVPVGGGSQLFTALIDGVASNAVSWFVNDIAGGDATVGLISPDGLYTAPSALPSVANVVIKAVSDVDATTFVEAQVNLSASCLANSLTVDSTLDAVDANIGDGLCDDGNGNCTLRAAIQEANACVGADQINIPAGTYLLTLAGVAEDASATGDLDILSDLKVVGAGARDTIIDGNGIDRVFHSPQGNTANLEISGLTIQNGVATTESGGGGIFQYGGNLVLSAVSVDNNRSPVGNGGGVYTRYCPYVSISDSTISNNAAQGAGWAVGGGILSTGAGVFDISNTTISGNSAYTSGGGMTVNGTVTTVVNSTIVNNSAPAGAGTYVRYYGNDAWFTFYNSILSNNGDNCGSNNGSNPYPFTASVDSLDTDGTCSNATTVADVQIGTLANNGGPTQTHLLASGSPAINAGDNNSCPTNDQRGVARSDGQCDIGAVEGSLSTLTCLGYVIQINSTLDAVDANIGDGVCDDGSGSCTLRAAVQEANACIGADVISIPAATHTLSLANTGGATAASGDLYISDELSIVGADVATAIIDGNGSVVNHSVFGVAANTAVSISALTIQNGGGARGGGIYNRGNLRLDNVLITANRVNRIGSSYGTGGGIYSSGDLVISNSTISNNYSTTSGSGIHNVGTASVSNCIVTGNTRGSGYWGAGITNSGSMSVESSRFSNNSDYGFRNENSATINASIFDGDRGGINNLSNLTVTNTTITNTQALGGVVNDAGTLNLLTSTLVANKGGGVKNGAAVAIITNTTISGTIPNQCNAGIHDDRGTVTVINSTITGTQIDPDDSWWCSTYGVNDTNSGGSISLINTIVSNNGNGDCIAGAAISSDAFSLISDGSCGAATATDPQLLPLTDNGGPTRTHALSVGSPAIDAGDNTNCPATDQRGVARSDGVCDVGAYEAP